MFSKFVIQQEAGQIMIHVKNNPQYYINARALTFSENDLGDPNRVAVSLVSGTVFMVHEKGTIDYASDGSYEKWTLRGYSTKLVKNDKYYIYARLSRADKTALIVFSSNSYNFDGSITTVIGKDEEGNDITSTTDPNENYFYVKIGELTETDGSSARELTYDSGLLGTDKAKDESDGLSEMWELSKLSTPWLIRAKQWLSDFTVKGFVRLIGGIKFSKGREGDEKTIVDIKRSVDNDEEVPINDQTIPTTKYIQTVSENKYLRKDKDDSTPFNLAIGGRLDVTKGINSKGDVIIGDNGYAEGLSGFGTKFGRDGSGEMSRLTLRHELRVPKLVFNSIEINVGDKWRGAGGGVIERVEPDYNTDGSMKDTGTIWLQLEEGQIGAVYGNAISQGIFHDFTNKLNNETADSEIYEDDKMIAKTFAGFTTVYFLITEISDYTDENGIVWRNKQCRYQLRPTSTNWTSKAHPYAQMNFVCYGVMSDDEELLEKYGTSAYETRTYTRLLWRQNTWEIGANNIASQSGDLSNLDILGLDAKGYSNYINSVYFTGEIRQVNPNTGEPIKTANDRGEWVNGTSYYYYDRVSHDGGLWLCVAEDGTNTEPKEGDAAWLLQVKSGTSVTAAGHWESSKVPYKVNSIVTFADKVWISNKETSEPPFGTYADKDGNRLVYKDGGYILVETLIQSEDWDLLLDAPQLTDGKDGESLQVRYSSDKSNWHSTFVEGDVWMQQRVGEGSVWSDAIRIVGESGAAGKDGTYHDYQFAVNGSLTIAPTTGWQDTPPAVGIGQYLWMRTRFVDPNSAEVHPWSVARIGGEKGRGVNNVTEYYQVSASNTEAPNTWQTEMPTMTEELKYLWNYEEVTYTDTEVVKTSPIVIGMYSKDGNGIKSVTETYGLTNGPNEQPTKWYADMPIPNKEVRYLWNKTVTEYTDGTPTTIIRIIAVHGETGDSIKNIGKWKTGLEVPALGMVTMGGKTFLSKVATTNPPMWLYTDKELNRLIYKDGGYVLTGELNTEEYELLMENGKDGKDGKDYEYIYAHTKENVKPIKPNSVQIDDNIPSGWHDDPIGVTESLPYEWVCIRTKKDGIWSDYSSPAIWAKFGMDAIVADLDNEMDNVALDAEGKTTASSTINIIAAMYYGTQKQALSSISVSSVSGVTSSYNLSTGVVTLSVNKGVSLADRNEIAISVAAYINGELQTRRLVFVLAGIRGGTDGQDAVLYDIVTSVSAVTKKKDGSYSVNSVSAHRTKTIGNKTIITTDGTLKYSIDGGTEKEIANSATIDVSNVTSKIQFTFYNADGVVVDKESIPMVIDGVDGEDGKDGIGIKSVTISYAKTTSNVNPNTITNWGSAIPTVGEGEYLWVRTITDYTDESKEDTITYTYTFQGKTGQSGASVSVKSIEYQEGNSPTIAPTGTWSKNVIEVSQGKYLWTKTSFSDGSVAYGVAKQGTDGKDGEGFTMMDNWETGMAVPKMGVVTMGGSCFAAKVATTNPPLWCWTDKDGNRFIFSDGGYLLTGETNNQDYQLWSVSGEQGPQGVAGTDGKDGVDGKTYYTWIRYADDENGGGISNNPSGKTYIGFAYNKPTATESNEPADYKWAEIKGEQGVPGEKGKDGTQYYTWIAYSDNADGSNMYQQPKESTRFIGIAVNKTTQTESTNPSDYTWSLFRGADGDGFSLMGNWKTGLTVPALGVVTMGGGSYAAKTATTNPPLWCWTDKDGNRLTFSANEYILTGEMNTSEYDRWSVKGEDGKDGADGQKGDKGDKGDAGEQGIQGCIIRDSEWVLGTQYRNDEALTSGTRYIDVVLVRNDSTATGWEAYKCKVTHTSTAATSPSNSAYWEKFGANITTIFTSLIIAKNAKINFLQGNQLLIQKNDGKVTAGLSGGDEGEKVRFWAGSDIPDSAPFSVTEDGVTTSSKFRTARNGLRMEVANGLISVFGSVAKNIEFGVNEEGLAVMRYYDNDGTLLYDLGPSGISSVKRDNETWNMKRLTFLGADVTELFSSYWNTAKNPLYNTGYDRWQYLSGFVGSVYDDAANNRKIFKSRSKTDSSGNSNVIDDGWYCDSLPQNASQLNRIQYPNIDGLYPDDMSSTNPNFDPYSPIYVTAAFYIQDGLVINRMNVYYNL